MDKQVDETLRAMTKSQEQIARALYAESIIVARLARMMRKVEPAKLNIQPGQPYCEEEHSVCREIAGYLHTLADLEDALADNLKSMIKELRSYRQVQE